MDIEQTRRKHEAELLQLPNVTGVGIGEKDGKPVVKVFVTHKVPAGDLRPQERVPRRLGDYSTDVEEIGTVQAL